MTHHFITISALTLTLLLSGCGGRVPAPSNLELKEGTAVETEFTVDTPIQRS